MKNNIIWKPSIKITLPARLLIKLILVKDICHVGQFPCRIAYSHSKHTPVVGRKSFKNKSIGDWGMSMKI